MRFFWGHLIITSRILNHELATTKFIELFASPAPRRWNAKMFYFLKKNVANFEGENNENTELSPY